MAASARRHAGVRNRRLDEALPRQLHRRGTKGDWNHGQMSTGKTGARYVMMSPRLLEALRTYWRACVAV